MVVLEIHVLDQITCSVNFSRWTVLDLIPGDCLFNGTNRPPYSPVTVKHEGGWGGGWVRGLIVNWAHD